MLNKNRKLIASYRLYRPITKFLALGLVLLVVLFMYFWLIPTIGFFVNIEKIPPWTISEVGVPPESYSLNQAKQTACFLISQPQWVRRHMIATYYRYTQFHDPDVSNSSSLYLVMRVLFDLPENQPVADAAIYAAWMGEGSPYPHDSSQETVNLLWPLGYNGERLVLKVTFVFYMGGPYNALAEYEYFSAHFPLRTTDKLNCT